MSSWISDVFSPREHFFRPSRQSRPEPAQDETARLARGGTPPREPAPDSRAGRSPDPHETKRRGLTAGAPRRRIHLMDELRGFAVFCMIFYHGFYTVGYIFNVDLGTLFFRFFMPAEPFYAGMFMFISGIACNLSHSNLKRGLKLLALALGVTLVTYFVLPDELIVFGILHFLSVCMILCGLLMPAIDRFGFSWAQVAVCAALFLFTVNVDAGFLGPGGPLTFALPQALYRVGWLAPLGMPGPAFRSADYFPLLPWVFVFFAGVFTGKLAKDGRFPEFMYRPRVPAFSWMGRHALILYLAHQPVIYGACLLIAEIGKRFAR